MKKRPFPASQMAIDAMLAAMCTAIAALITLKLGGNLEITFESVPVHIAALLFGPVDGMIVAGIGNFIYQLLFSGYGLTATTALWILPYIVCGFIVGAYARRRARSSGTLVARSKSSMVHRRATLTAAPATSSPAWPPAARPASQAASATGRHREKNIDCVT